MSKSLEIYPRFELPKNWKTVFLETLSNDIDQPKLEQFVKGNDRYFILNSGDQTYFHLSFSLKDREVFSDEEYLEDFIFYSDIDEKHFLSDFKLVDYTIALESKPTSPKNARDLMKSGAIILSELTKGVVLFDQPYKHFTHSTLYSLEDLKKDV